MPGAIRVKVVQLGKQVFDFEGQEPCTIGEALRAARVIVDHLRTDIRLNGEVAAESTILHDGDIITVLPPVKGG